MSHHNQILYFMSQTYRQVQLSVERGATPYLHGDFARQFDELMTALNDETHARRLLVNLVEEAAALHESTDYLRQELDYEVEAARRGGPATDAPAELAQRRQQRHR